MCEFCEIVNCSFDLIVVFPLIFDLIRSSIPLRTMETAQSMTPPVPEETAEKDLKKVEGFAWSAARAGSVYTGAMPLGLGAFLYQFEGNKLVASVDVMEMCVHENASFEALLQDESCRTTVNFTQAIQSAAAQLRDLDEESCNQDRVPSLRVSYIIPGDIFYLPFSSLVCEKSLGMSISLRLVSCFAHALLQKKIGLLRRVWDGPLSFYFFLQNVSSSVGMFEIKR